MFRKKHSVPLFLWKNLRKKVNFFHYERFFVVSFLFFILICSHPFFGHGLFLSQETHFYNPWGGRETLHSYIPPPLFIKRGVEEEKEEFKVPSTDWKGERKGDLKSQAPVSPSSPLNFFPGSS